MQTVKLTKNNHHVAISKAVKVLKSGGLVIYPTETCYGAGVLTTSQSGVDKLLAYKSRREGKPLSIAVVNQTMASKYVTLNTSSKNLYKKFLPGPLTVISKSKGKVAKGVESEIKTLGIRIPNYPLILDIVRELNIPITATSANASYKKKPYSIQDILNNTSKKQQASIDLVIDAGTLPKRPSSTVVDTTLDDLILRGSTKSILEVKLQGSTLKNSNNDSPSRKPSKVTTNSTKETINLAKTLMLKNWNTLQKRPLMLLLIGNLGAGKTQFAKGIGQFLKITQPITSPTYTIEKEYSYTRHNVSGKFLHLDTWRLQNIEELDLLKLKSRLKPKTVIAIEWASRTLNPLLNLAKQTQAKVVTVNIKTHKSNQNHREITIN